MRIAHRLINDIGTYLLRLEGEPGQPKGTV
jgi:hypothetical protein